MLWSFIRPELVDAEAGAAVWPAATVPTSSLQFSTVYTRLSANFSPAAAADSRGHSDFEKGFKDSLAG